MRIQSPGVGEPARLPCPKRLRITLWRDPVLPFLSLFSPSWSDPNTSQTTEDLGPPSGKQIGLLSNPPGDSHRPYQTNGLLTTRPRYQKRKIPHVPIPPHSPNNYIPHTPCGRVFFFFALLPAAPLLYVQYTSLSLREMNCLLCCLGGR